MLNELNEIYDQVNKLHNSMEHDLYYFHQIEKVLELRSALQYASNNLLSAIQTVEELESQ